MGTGSEPFGWGVICGCRKFGLWNIYCLDGGQGCGRVFSELVLRKKNCSCIDAWRWDLEMLLP